MLVDAGQIYLSIFPGALEDPGACSDHDLVNSAMALWAELHVLDALVIMHGALPDLKSFSTPCSGLCWQVTLAAQHHVALLIATSVPAGFD